MDRSFIARGACRMVDDPDIFFYERDRKQRDAALEVCAGCPVLEQCREWALYQWPINMTWTIGVVVGGLYTAELLRERERLGIEHPHFWHPIDVS